MVWLCACLVDGDLYRERHAQLTDDDGDRWTEVAGDCNDADATLHPGAPEICNQTDDDCDGSVDEDVPTWFLDHDEDGAGDATTTVATCSPSSGFVDNDGDCNDDDAAVRPGAAELCNGIDDDCDDLIDGEDESLEGVALYADTDADGFGDDATEYVGCPGDKDTVDVGGDCDDSTQAVHPGATPEICEDGVDTNCDGVGLGCTGSAANADTALFGESDGDEASLSTASGVDVDGDGYTDLLVGATSDDDGGSDAGAVYVLRGPIPSGRHGLSTAWVKLTGSAGDKTGRAVAFAGDVDDDGIQDVAVGAVLHDGESYLESGSVFLVSASDLSSGISSLASWAYGEIRGDRPYDYCGSAVAGAGDQDGDGDDDLWIGAVGAGTAPGGEDAGSVFLVLGPFNGGLAFVGSERRAELIGLGYYPSAVGTVLAPGDFDGDGLGDIAIGDRWEDTVGYLSGAVFVVTGPVSGASFLDTADAKLLSGAAFDELGTSLSSSVDLDEDGRDDLVVGAPKVSTTGAAYLFLGGSSIGPWSGSASTNASGTLVSGGADVRDVGSGVASGGDFDNDGAQDVLVGAAASGALGQGAAFLVTGITSGTLGLDSGGGSVLFRMNGEGPNDGLGTSVGFTGPIATGSDQGVILSSSTLNVSGKEPGGSYLVWTLGL